MKGLAVDVGGLDDLSGLTALAVYLVVFGFVFAESGLLIGFFLPGDTLLFAAGLLSADPARGVSYPVLVIGVLVAAVSGDFVGYTFGRRAGRPLLERRDGRVLNRTNLARAQDFYERFGRSAVVVARFVPWVRTFAPILAGVAEMPYRRFVVANVVGALLWGAGLITLGRLAGSNPLLRDIAIIIGVGFATLSALHGAVRYIRARRRAADR